MPMRHHSIVIHLILWLIDNASGDIPGKYLDFVPLHVPPCVSTELYVEASTAFYVDFLQYITYKFSQTKMLFSTLKNVEDFYPQ